LRGRAREGGNKQPRPELSIVFTDDSRIRQLNARYRGKDRATNVLSFPQKDGALLGDVILAAETIRGEAVLADKPLEDHMAHLIIHGFLHLLGYDHEGDAEAEKMEQLERLALGRLGIADPYAAAVSQ
jgi:probable rRNA maturation factor